MNVDHAVTALADLVVSEGRGDDADALEFLTTTVKRLHRRWTDPLLVDRAAAFLHSQDPGTVGRVPWEMASPDRQVRMRNQARGVLQLVDGTLHSFPGDPGPGGTA